ncbi:MAG: amidohydrolase family protein [Bacteroidota bacterium]
MRFGTFYDGLGGKGVRKDLILQDGKVKESISKAPNIENAQEIDATGKWVMPGFLDIHTHYDAEVEVLPGLDESIRHGVTTVVFGNCSISAAMGKDEDIVDLFCRVENLPAQVLSDWIKDKISWKNLGEYYEHLEGLNIGPNIATLIGHSNVRIGAMGLDRSFRQRKASNEELNKMQAYVDEAMEAGYLGMSIDMLPFHRWGGAINPAYKGVSIPSQQAAVKEYRRLANVLRKHDRVLQATPNALDKMSVINLLRMSSGLGRKKLKTTIVAAMDLKSDHKIYKLATGLATFANTFLNANVRWQALSMPFLNFGEGPVTPLFEEFPSMVEMIGADAASRKATFGDPKFRAWFKKDWNHKTTSVFPRLLSDMWITDAPDKSLVGKSFDEVAKKAGADPLDHFMDLIKEYDMSLKWKVVAANHREKQRIKLLNHDTTIPGFNDSGAHNTNMAFHDGSLQTLRQAQANPDLLPVERAIHRMTKVAADFLNIDAGSLENGKRADVVVMDPSKLQSNLTDEPYEDFHPAFKGASRLVKRSDGVVNQVLVNGNLVFDEGQFDPQLGQKRYGKLLRALN